MPYKFHESRREKIEKSRYRVTNWQDYLLIAGLIAIDQQAT